MTDKRSSTGATTLAAFNDDPELQRLIRDLERHFRARGNHAPTT
jgi:hypothetical protein